MARFIGLGYGVEDLLILNRVRKHKQVLFLSDIFGAGNKLLGKQYLQKRWDADCWSTMRFPREMVTEVEMHLWRMAITQVVAAGPAHNKLGTFVAEGHKIWDWRTQEKSG